MEDIITLICSTWKPYHLQPRTTKISDNIFTDFKEEKSLITQVNFLSNFFSIDLEEKTVNPRTSSGSRHNFLDLDNQIVYKRYV